ncbi:hypothetical protein R6Q59_023313 [Mikania micrantha]
MEKIDCRKRCVAGQNAWVTGCGLIGARYEQPTGATKRREKQESLPRWASGEVVACWYSHGSPEIYRKWAVCELQLLSVFFSRLLGLKRLPEKMAAGLFS